MTRRPALLLALALTPFLGFSQSGNYPASPRNAFTLPAGAPLPVQIDQNLPMRAGTAIRARLLYPVYAGDTLLLPAQTTLLGSIVSLTPDRARRIHARLNIDFTPFHTPVVRFTQVLLADGTALPLVSGDATNGAPIFRIVAPPPSQGGFLHQRLGDIKQGLHDRLSTFTAPDKGDRFVQLLYSQLPYHPERVPKDTAWTVETTAPVFLAQLPAQPLAQLPAQPAKTLPDGAKASEGPPTWMVQAYLNNALDSATTRSGQPIKATVAEPIYNPDGTVAVPQGAVLVGAVTKSKPARRFGRAGALSFSFRQLVLPGGDAQSVQTSLKGADFATSADLAMTSEGEVKPKPQDKIAVPLLLIALAARPLDRDGGRHMLGKDAVASNSLGLIGFVVGIAAQQPYLAAGIGYYGAALSIYDRWIARGKQVAFAKDTRIVLQTTGRRSEAIKPTATPSQ